VVVKPARIELHVEELVLHGFAPGDKHRIADALQTELRQLLAQRGLPAGLASSAGGRAPDVKLSPREGPRAAGQRIAAAVHAALAPAPPGKERKR
jgi:hypothetical protein